MQQICNTPFAQGFTTRAYVLINSLVDGVLDEALQVEKPRLAALQAGGRRFESARLHRSSSGRGLLSGVA